MTARKPAKPEATMADMVAEMEANMKGYQQAMSDSVAKYECLVSEATANLNRLVEAAKPAPKPAPVQPIAQWIDADDEKCLVLNVAAAEFFTAIFAQVGKVASELAKMAPTKG